MQLTRSTDCEDRAYLAGTAGYDLMILELILPKLSRVEGYAGAPARKFALPERALRSGLSSASEKIPSRSRGSAKFERLGGGFGFRSLGNWSGASLLLSRRAPAPIFPNAPQSDFRPIVARDGF